MPVQYSWQYDGTLLKSVHLVTGNETLYYREYTVFPKQFFKYWCKASVTAEIFHFDIFYWTEFAEAQSMKGISLNPMNTYILDYSMYHPLTLLSTTKLYIANMHMFTGGHVLTKLDF